MLLRGHRSADLDDCFAMWTDPDVVRFIGGKPSTRQQTWSRILAYRGHWALLGFGYWAVEEIASGSLIGEVGFADFKRDIHPAMRGVPELGWALRSEAHGKGYGTEAVRAVIDWGDLHLSSPRAVCLIDLDNQPSLRVAHKCGYRQFMSATFGERPNLFLERTSRRLEGSFGEEPPTA